MTQLNSTQLNSTQLNSTQLNSTQLNSTQLNSTQLSKNFTTSVQFSSLKSHPFRLKVCSYDLKKIIHKLFYEQIHPMMDSCWRSSRVNGVLKQNQIILDCPLSISKKQIVGECVFNKKEVFKKGLYKPMGGV